MKYSTVVGVIEQGVVSANETVNVFWDGTIDGAKLPDDTYTIRVTVDDGGDAKEVLYATAILDSSAPRVFPVSSQGTMIRLPTDVPITDGGFIKEPLHSIKVTGEDDREEGIDLGNRRTTVFLRNEQQVVVRGNLNYDGN